MKQETLFYIQLHENDPTAGGPYDLAQMASLLQRKIITSETPTLLKGEPHTDWIPFCERPQYFAVKEMAPGVVSLRMEALREEAEVARNPLGLPSRETVFKVGVYGAAALLVLLAVGALTYLVARQDIASGICLLAIGLVLVTYASAMIYVTILNEDWWTLAKIFFVPFFEFFYFLANLEKYLPYFVIKYIGIVIIVAALAGLAANASPHAQEIPSLFHH